MSACFEYGQKETEYLKSKDKKLAACIERIGHIERAVDTDLFSSVVHLFCLQRPNVFSYGDLAILRGLRMVYRHRRIGRDLFEKYRRRFSPCCSVASLYLWAVAGGAMEELTDPAAKFQTKKGASRKNGAQRRSRRFQ